MAGKKTIYIDDETEQALDRLAVIYGGHSQVIRAAVRQLTLLHTPDPNPDPLARIERHLQAALREINGEWERQGWAEEAAEANEILEGDE